MSWMVLLAFLVNPLLLQQNQNQPRAVATAPAAQAQPGATPAQPAPPAIKDPTGPMRIELIAIGDSRVKFWNEAFAKTANSGMRTRFMLTGERLGEVVRAGRLILDKIVDDTGKSYVDSKLDDEARTATNPVNVTKQVMAQGGLDLYLDLDFSPRKATRFTEIAGYVNVVMGANPSSTSFRNPNSFQGKDLTSAELAAAGIKAHVVATDQMSEPPTERGLALQFAEGEPKIRSVDYYDEWFRRMPSRSRPGKTKDGKSYTFYPLLSGTLTDDSTLVIEFFQKSEQMKVPVSLKDIEMP